jgi:hypothetical protein
MKNHSKRKALLKKQTLQDILRKKSVMFERKSLSKKKSQMFQRQPTGFVSLSKNDGVKVEEIKNDSMALYMKKIMGIQNVYTI